MATWRTTSSFTSFRKYCVKDWLRGTSSTRPGFVAWLLMGRASAHDYMYVCASDRATGQCVVTQAAPNQPQDAVVPLMYPVRWPGRNPGYIRGTDSSGITCAH